MKSALARPAERWSDAIAHRIRSRGREGLADVLFVPALLLALGIYLSISNEFFLTRDNLTNVLIQASILAIVSFGATFVIIAGELDLSVGSGVALVSVVSALAMRDSGSILLGLLAGIGVGLALGLVNGLIVTRLEVPSFIATLGTLVIAGAVALYLTDGGVVTGLPEGIGALTDETFLGLEWIIWLTFAVFAVLLVLEARTGFGLRVFATGGNREAARLAGIPVGRVRLMVFVLSGLTIGIAGIALTSRVESGQPNAANLLELTAIAAIVVGGTSLTGGRGSVVRTLFGVLLIVTLRNGLDLEAVNDDLKNMVTGLVLIAAASVDFFRRRLRRRPTLAVASAADPAASASPDPDKDSPLDGGSSHATREKDR